MLKLHFGCGPNKLTDWQNLDLPTTDARKPLTYKNDSVDFIFHEHMIEHLDEVDGFNFMKECFRVLKPGGVMRVSCPSIDGFIYCYTHWDEMNSEFRNSFGTKTNFINHATLGEAAFFQSKRFKIDGSVYSIRNSEAWHKFYYDKEDMSRKLERIGFSNVRYFDKHMSDYPELCGLERRLGGKFKDFPPELDMTLEAIKPAA